MTKSPPLATHGVQAPRILSAPRNVTGTAGPEAIELAKSAGLILDPWEANTLTVGLGERANGTWAAFEVGLICPRQNGKGSVLEARELAGLFLFGERTMIHSAHLHSTAKEHFARLRFLIENAPHLNRRVKAFRTSGEETSIELRDGAKLRFLARTGKAGRGFSADFIALDEAFNLSSDMIAALLPTMGARPNPQLWYSSSAGLEDSDVLASVRQRGIAGEARMAYFEWSAPDGSDLDDRHAWRQANPGIGYRLSDEFIEIERRAMPDAEFARERLGIWEDPGNQRVITDEVWSVCQDRRSEAGETVAFALDIPPDRAAASIAVASRRDDGRMHLEVVAYGKGTDWVTDRLIELNRDWLPLAVGIDAAGPAASFLPELEEAKLPIVTTSSREMTQACGLLYDDAHAEILAHIGQPGLTTAVAAGRKRPLGDAWAWRRADGYTDISPLVAITLARYVYADQAPKQRAPQRAKTRVVVM